VIARIRTGRGEDPLRSGPEYPRGPCGSRGCVVCGTMRAHTKRSPETTFPMALRPTIWSGPVW